MSLPTTKHIYTHTLKHLLPPLHTHMPVLVFSVGNSPMIPRSESMIKGFENHWIKSSIFCM